MKLRQKIHLKTAVASWQIVIDGAPKSEARRHYFSIRFGHMPFGPTQVLDAFLTNG